MWLSSSISIIWPGHQTVLSDYIYYGIIEIMISRKSPMVGALLRLGEEYKALLIKDFYFLQLP